MLRAIKHDRPPLGEIKLGARVSVLGPLRSYFRFPPDRIREARERSVSVRSKRAKGSNVGVSLVDDTLLNVERAKAVGWRGILFSDSTQLQQDLSDLFQPNPNREP